MFGAKLKRLNGWEGKLALFEKRQETFDWGVCDCTLFVCDWIESATGVDLASEARGRYSTSLGAIRAVKKYCGGDLVDRASLYFGTPQTNMNFAQRGDLVLLPNEVDNLPLFGVVCSSGREIVTISSDQGVVKTPIENGLKFWRV